MLGLACIAIDVWLEGVEEVAVLPFRELVEDFADDEPPDEFLLSVTVSVAAPEEVWVIVVVDIDDEDEDEDVKSESDPFVYTM